MTTNIEIPKGYKLYDGPKDDRWLRDGMFAHPGGFEWAGKANGGTFASEGYTYIVPDDSPAAPWTLPPPPAGHAWHRDDWTQEMLPDGWRPLLKGEKAICGEGNDEMGWLISGKWFWSWQDSRDHIPKCDKYFWRTRRPLPSAPTEPADPYAELRAAHAAGKTIEYRTLASEKWVTRDDPSWCAEPDRYRIKPEPKPSPSDDGWIPWNGGECPVDGDAIVSWKMRCGEVRGGDLDDISDKAKCRDWAHFNSVSDIIAYRVISQPEPEKPWTLPDPPEGRQWHRTDGWKKEDLDGGWRPLMADEKCESGDEFNAHNEGIFVPVERDEFQGTTFLKHNVHCRTKRPLPSVQQSPTQPPPGMRILAKEECDGEWRDGAMFLDCARKWSYNETCIPQHRGESGCYCTDCQPIAVPIAEPEPVKEEPVASTTAGSTTTKTIREWLETLPEPYRSDALGNAPKSVLHITYRCLDHAISGAFLWSRTPQGYCYWESIGKGLDPHTKLPLGTEPQEDDWLPEKGKPYEVLPPRSTKWQRWEEATNDAHFYKEMIRMGVKYRPVKSDLPKPEEPATRHHHHLGTGFIYADLRTQDPLWVTDNIITSTNPEQTENNNNMNTSATITSLPELPPVGSKWAVVYEGETKTGKIISAGPQGIFIKGRSLSCLYTVDTWNSRPKTRIYSKRELRQQAKTQKERHKGIIACASGSDSTKPPFSLKRWALRKTWEITKLTSLYGIGVITAPITGPLIKAGLMSAGAVIWSVVSRLVQQ